MTSITNFDQSSSGINLELSCSYDSDLAKFWFDETFHVLQYSGYRTNAVYVYGLHVLDVSDFSTTDPANWDCKKVTVKNLRQYFVKEFGYDFCDIMSLTKLELLTELLNETLDTEVIEELGAVPKFHTLTSRGYRQGDFAEVIVPFEVMEAIGNSDLNSYQTEIDNLLWDSPVYCRLTIDGEEIDLCENLESLYNWDCDKVIKQAKQNEAIKASKHRETVINFLEENLPEYPDYE